MLPLFVSIILRNSHDIYYALQFTRPLVSPYDEKAKSTPTAGLD